MLARLHDKAFDSKDWIFEIKWDGYRAIAEVDGDYTRLYSRNGLSFQNDYPIVFEELKKIKHQVILDGEIAALNEKGVSSFQLLQQYAKDGSVPLCYYVFDCLAFDGYSLEDQPLIERKELLKKLLPESDVIKYSDHVDTNGTAFFKAMQQQNLEGMIAKRKDSTYTEGARSNDWLKIKHTLMEEAVIAGYTEARGGRKYFGALVLGTYQGNKLVYIGHTGTGFDHATLKDVHEQLQPLVTDESPFDTKVPVNSPVTWVKPKLVCNLKYSEITKDGHRRHPVFMGLRIDKSAHQVHPDFPVDTDKKKSAMLKKTNAKKATAKKATIKKSVAAKKTAANKTTPKKEATRKIGGQELKFSNLDKVYWPKEGYTKGDVIEYYNKIYPHIIKYLKDRPESMFRTPNGIGAKGFFQKDASSIATEWTKTELIWSDSNNADIEYLICNDKQTLLYMANLGCIELNPWNSRIGKLDNPDYFVMDIDPSEKNTFEQVIETALVIKEVLDRAGAVSFPKTSGASGIHIYVPLGAKYTYDQAKDFAHIIATLAQAQLPDFTSLERSLSKRGKSNIYIDYLQNRRGQTLSCAYSLRPKPGATVSTPLLWKEVKSGLHPSDFTIKNILQRVEKKGDLFADVLKKGIDMKAALKKLGV